MPSVRLVVAMVATVGFLAVCACHPPTPKTDQWAVSSSTEAGPSR
jgi:hypothetical protein